MWMKPFSIGLITKIVNIFKKVTKIIIAGNNVLPTGW
jgi:hypothetical protein